MAQIGGDDIDRLLERGMDSTAAEEPHGSRSRSKRRDKSPRRRERSRSRDRGRRRESSQERKLRRDAEEIERDQRTVFACQVHPRVDERDIFEFFSQAGKVRDVQLIRDARSGKSKGLVYIEFHKQESVAQALAFSGQLLGGYPISVQVTQAEKNRAAAAAIAAANVDGPMKLFIQNLSKDVTDDDLEPIFSAFGDIKYLELSKSTDAQGNQTGTVEFRKASEARAALQNLNGLALLNQNMTLSSVDLSAVTLPMNQPTVDIPGLSTSQLDEGHGGMQMSANSRLMLMQRLQASGVGGVPPIGSGANNVKMPSTTNPMAAMVTHMPTPSITQFVQLKNMFDPSRESGPSWELDIAEDVKDECSKFGRVEHIFVDKRSMGHVYLKFSNPMEAKKACDALHGRWFAQKQIQATFVPQAVYEQKFPDAFKR